MQPKGRRPAAKDPRAKLTPEERKRAKPPPVERKAFEDVIRRLVTLPPGKRKSR